MDNLIDRQAAIDAVNCVMIMKGIRSGKSVAAEAVESAKGIIVANIRQLPSAQPERINGHWIEHDDGLVACECSVCHEKYNLYEEDVFGRNFCPNCGADMRGEDNETD